MHGTDQQSKCICLHSEGWGVFWSEGQGLVPISKIQGRRLVEQRANRASISFAFAPTDGCVSASWNLWLSYQGEVLTHSI